MKKNRILPRITAIYANNTVNLNINSIKTNPEILPATFNKGKIDAIPHLTLVRGFVRKGIFHIEQWIYSQDSVKQCIAYN